MTMSEVMIVPSAFMMLAEAYCIYALIHRPFNNMYKKAFRIACASILTALWAMILIFSLMGLFSDFPLYAIVGVSILDMIIDGWHDFWKHNRTARKVRAKAMTFVQRTKHLRNKLAGDNKKTAKRAGIPDTD